MGIFMKILASLPILPGIIQGIEALHQGVSNGASKKELALAALGLAAGTAQTIAPEFAPEIGAATELAGGAIDLIVKGFNAAGWGGHGVVPVLPVNALPVVIASNVSKQTPPLRVIG